MRAVCIAFGLALLLAGAGCKTTQLGSVIGAGTGAAIGSQIGSGWGTVAATVGLSAVGALLGSEIADALDDRSREQAAGAAGSAITKGESSTWSNAEAGTKGSATVTGQSQRRGDIEVTVLKDRVDQMPPLELVSSNFVTTGEANVRGGPGTDYKVLDSLTAGRVVEVVGKVQGEPWYLISQGGAASGFVSASLLKPTDAVATTAKPEGETQTRQVATVGTCRTVNQSITLADGTTKTDDVTACQTENGWEVVQ